MNEANQATERFRTYIQKMNRASVFIIVAGVVLSCAALLASVLLFHTARDFSSPLRVIILSEKLFEAGSTLFLTAPLCAFILDMFVKALRREK